MSRPPEPRPRAGLRHRWRAGSAVSHLGAALLVGLAVAGALALSLRLEPMDVSIAGWASAASTYVFGTWLATWPLDADQTRAVATREDTSRPVANAIVLTAAVISLLVVAFVLVGGKNGGHPLRLTLGVAAIVVSWQLVHTMWWMHYARLYYTVPEGGIDFNQVDGGAPVYSDFAYLAFTVGMAFQVSDQMITQQRMRRAVLAHAALAFVFVAVILAVTINIVAGL